MRYLLSSLLITVLLAGCGGTATEVVADGLSTPQPPTAISAPAATTPLTQSLSSQPTSTPLPAAAWADELVISCSLDDVQLRVSCKAPAMGDAITYTWSSNASRTSGGQVFYFALDDERIKPEIRITLEACRGESCKTIDTFIDTSHLLPEAPSPTPPPPPSLAATDRPASNPLVAIIEGDDSNLQDCVLQALGEDRYQELRSRQPTAEEMEIAGPCIAGERQAGDSTEGQGGAERSTEGTRPASNPLVAIIEGDDSNLQDCVLQALGEDRYQELRSRQPTAEEMEIAGPCLSGDRTALECPATNDVTSTAWVVENTLFSRHYWGIETPREGRQGPYESTGAADPRVIQLPDGRYRMYFAGGDLQEVTYVSTATSTDGVNFSLDDARILDIPKGTNGGGAHTSFAPLDDGSWRVYASTRGVEDRHILSYKAEDGLQLVQDPGRRLTLNEVGGGDLMSPYVIRDPAGGYRMFLTKAPDGEKVGQVGGTSTTWIVSAISDDGLNWSMTDQVLDNAQRPSALVNDDGTIELWFTFGMGAGLLRMKDVMHDGDLSMGEIESMNIKAMDVDVHRIAGGGYRVYGGFGSVNEGGSIRVLRSVTVPWRVELVYLGMNRDPEGEILGVCISGTSDEPIKLEAHLSLAERIPIDTRIVDPMGVAPFSTTLIHVGDEPPHRDVWLTVTSGDYIQEFRLTNYVPKYD